MKRRTAAILAASGFIILTCTACVQGRQSLDQQSLDQQSLDRQSLAQQSSDRQSLAQQSSDRQSPDRQSPDQKLGEEHSVVIAKPVYPTEPDREDFDAWEKFREENEVEETFLQSVNDFAFKTSLPLLKGREENAVYSPASLYYALSLASCGTSGETARALNVYLGTENSDTAAEQAGRLYRWLFKDNDISKTIIATSIWQSGKLHMKPSFVETATDNYYASVFSVDFGDPGTARQMGEWVKEQTGGTISPEIQTNPEQVMHLMNTIYFYDEWINRFDRSETKTDSFYPADGGTVEAEFMNIRFGSHGFSKGDGFTRSYLGLKSNGSMVFVLPDEGVSLDSLLESEERLKEALEGGVDGMGEVTFKLPKFNLDSHFDIKSMMEQTEVRALFSDGDFSNMTEDDGVFISSITQDGHIAINEDGVEASAFTDIAYAGAALPDGKAEMILDRPFLYGIKSQGVWLFIGVCDNPAAVFLTNRPSETESMSMFIGGADGPTAIYVAGKPGEDYNMMDAIPFSLEAVSRQSLPDKEVLKEGGHPLSLDYVDDRRLILHGSFGIGIFEKINGVWQMTHSLDMGRLDERYASSDYETSVFDNEKGLIVGFRTENRYEDRFLIYNEEDETLVEMDKADVILDGLYELYAARIPENIPAELAELEPLYGVRELDNGLLGFLSSDGTELSSLWYGVYDKEKGEVTRARLFSDGGNS